MNDLHLLELEELFTQVCYEYHSEHHDSLYEAALRTCPDVFLHHSDEYMAALINDISREH